jgi:glycosyltransferase involved in cell wall biosynthesis
VPVATVIVPARNAAATIGRTLDALAAQDLDERFEVVVVDDGSTDRTFELAEGYGPPVRAMRNVSPAGAGAARNAGARAAAGEFLAFTDADCYPVSTWLSAGLAALESAELVQGAVRPEPGTPLGPFDRTVWVTGENGLYETANILVRRDLFERLGGFEDWLAASGRPMGEDLWFGWRARRAGAATAFCDDALVHHAVFARSPVAYAAERARLIHFPAIAARIPELRERFFFRRWFLNERSAAFDAAVLGVAAALRTRSPLPLAAAAPYARLLSRRAHQWRGDATRVAVADFAADAIGLAALLAGSIRHRSPLL